MGAKLKLGIAAIVKDEMPYLLEWLAFHRSVGVDNFIIADNGSTDGTRQFLEHVAELGWLTVIDFPMLPSPGRSAQTMAYATILKECSPDIDLLAFIDADEFLTPYGKRAWTIKEFLARRFSSPDVSALALNWACFGSSGLIFHEPEPVIERFTRRALKDFNPNHHYKTVVRPSAVRRFMNPHHVELLEGKYINAAGTNLDVHPKFGVGLSVAVLWQGVRINHYVVKSAQEFIEFKSKRGSAAKAGRIKRQKYFTSHDKNDERCFAAHRLAPQVRLEMQAITEQLAVRFPGKYGSMNGEAAWYKKSLRKIFGKK